MHSAGCWAISFPTTGGIVEDWHGVAGGRVSTGCCSSFFKGCTESNKACWSSASSCSSFSRASSCSNCSIAFRSSNSCSISWSASSWHSNDSSCSWVSILETISKANFESSFFKASSSFSPRVVMVSFGAGKAFSITGLHGLDLIKSQVPTFPHFLHSPPCSRCLTMSWIWGRSFLLQSSSTSSTVESPPQWKGKRWKAS